MTKPKKKFIVPTYLCGRCGMTLNYSIVCHYTIETDKEHKCKPILKEPRAKPAGLDAAKELQRYNESISKTDKQKVLQTDNKPWWRPKKV